MRRLLTTLAAGSLFLLPLTGCSDDLLTAPKTGASSNSGQPTGTIIKHSTTFAGTWDTTYGTMTLTVDGIQVVGTYPKGGIINGTTDDAGKLFKGTWSDNTGSGRLTLTLADDANSFNGEWSDNATPDTKKTWNGTRQ